MVTLQLRQLVVEPGQRLRLQDVAWSEFEAILAELGENRTSRVAYSDGILEIRMPSPKHEKAKVLIGDMVKILLDELELEAECFGSSTFKRQAMAKGIEPDDCFYITHAAEMIGKEEVDLERDPPDLAIEVDITSKTSLAAYRALGVAELWQFEGARLVIKSLGPERYEAVERSVYFPGIAVVEGVMEGLAVSQRLGRRQALKEFRKWMQKQL